MRQLQLITHTITLNGLIDIKLCFVSVLFVVDIHYNTQSNIYSHSVFMSHIYFTLIVNANLQFISVAVTRARRMNMKQISVPEQPTN